PGWNNYQYTSPEKELTLHNIDSPQHCCMLCVNDPDCVEWKFSVRTSKCFLYYNTSIPETCSDPNIQPSSTGDEGGVIRCSDDYNNVILKP
ncbi:1764_t:CDS:1, partial [Dentiscutata heterogama]